MAYLNLDMAGSLNGANLVYNEVAVAEVRGDHAGLRRVADGSR